MEPSKQMRHTLPWDEANAAERMGVIQKAAYWWCYTPPTEFDPLTRQFTHHDALPYTPHTGKVAAFSADELANFLPPFLHVIFQPAFCGWVVCRETQEKPDRFAQKSDEVLWPYYGLEPLEKRGYSNRAVAIFNALRIEYGEKPAQIVGLNALYERALAGGDYLV